MKRREEPIPTLSAGLSHVMMTGVLLYAAFPAMHPSPAPFVPSPEVRSTLTAPAPVTPSSEAPAVVATPPEKDEWQQAEIVRAREQCMHVLSGASAEVEMLEPIKKGQCGTPAPVRLKSIGSDPEIVFDPPVDINCQMVAALGKWAKSTLQPKAIERLKSPVVRIVGASGYSCRNVYNLPNGRLSQHALANAIDIGGFGLENGRMVGVLKGWGLTERDIKALAKAKAEAKAKTNRAKGSDDADKGREVTAVSKEKGKTGSAVTQASLTSASQKLLSLKNKSVVAALPAPVAGEPAKPTKDALFLRAIHGGACGDFGTVLGPEANDPHRNHFHLDLIPRRSSSYCE
jgi:hypothetical protein